MINRFSQVFVWGIFLFDKISLRILAQGSIPSSATISEDITQNEHIAVIQLTDRTRVLLRKTLLFPMISS